ncbi:hypothetical protein QR692_09860 [Lactococcus petauri]|uniref:hypothetical protein n=1 Tax=Lactococcus petauri TaxID=1940789 RepID=UPI00207889C9|nr:hypothetical protein [Lactococcus petauri]USI65287.1 hypothetical protein LMK05_10745 [Lactococcus petauri]USI67782.1 hypothetical protein LMK04_09980 [Lactococcus petauri]WJE12443.1 hypothetical protein QR692_09860 [Lactococcus petauri]
MNEAINACLFNLNGYSIIKIGENQGRRKQQFLAGFLLFSFFLIGVKGLGKNSDTFKRPYGLFFS